MKNKKEYGLFVKLTEEEDRMVKKMKREYCMNMSQFVRKTIREFYNKLEKGNVPKKI